MPNRIVAPVMLETIEAIYENGTFKPLQPVDLPEGTPVQVSTKATLQSTVAEAQRKAARYVLTHLGDALSVGAPRLQGQETNAVWCFDIFRRVTHELRGELRLHAETGEVIAWLPVAVPTSSAIS
jgi:predicted DNA-binding antitoxin AbrB/MazE fold protein